MLRVVFCLLLLTPTLSWALVPPYYGKSDDEYRWQAEVELGLAASRGNTRNDAYNSRVRLGMDTDRTHQELVFSSNFARDKDTTSAERYRLELQSDAKLWPNYYLFVRGNQLFDRFGTYRSESSVATGLGTSLISRRYTSLKFELGPGYRLLEAGHDTGEEDEKEAILRSVLKYERRIHERTRFNASIELEAGQENTIGMVDAYFTNQLFGDLALKFGVNYRYTQQVDDESANSDTLSSLNLLYTF